MPKPKKSAATDSEERYQAFIRNSSEGIWRFEVDSPIPIKLKPAEQIKLMYKNAYLAEANEAVAKMYDAPSAAALVGLRLPEFLIESDPANTEYLKAFIESGYNLAGVDSHEVSQNGEEKYFRNSLIGIVEDGLLVRAWGTQQDVTEHHKAVEDLRKSEERLALALQASKTGIWEWNIATGELTWSDKLKELFGLKPRDSITYKKYLTFLHPEDRKLMQNTIAHAREHGADYKVEHRIIWKDGSIHWILGQGQAFLENGKAVRMVGTSVNIDDRKYAEIMIQESEARFRSMADSAPVLIWIADTSKACTYFNQTWLAFTGRTMEQEIGDGWADDIHPDDLKRCVRIYTTSFDARKNFTMEYRLRRYDGKYHWIMDKGAPRFSHTNEFLGYIGSCIDIEDMKRSSERRRKLEARTVALTKERTELVALNNAKDEFISLASHQLRTPATGVKQYIGMLLEGYAGNLTKEQKRTLKTAYESNERQLQIINDLLRVAHIDAGKVTIQPEPTDLIHLLEDVISEQQTMFKNRDQTVDFNYTQASFMLSIDRDRMRMVFENILDNASKYTPHHKKITVAVTEHPANIHVAITDQGVGIAKKDMEKLFQKFSRVSNILSNSVGGTGLGLYWAKKIVDLHGGSISVTSKVGIGSMFTIKIPRM